MLALVAGGRGCHAAAGPPPGSCPTRYRVDGLRRDAKPLGRLPNSDAGVLADLRIVASRGSLVASHRRAAVAGELRNLGPRETGVVGFPHYLVGFPHYLWQLVHRRAQTRLEATSLSDDVTDALPRRRPDLVRGRPLVR